jgi:hypothetical protein
MKLAILAIGIILLAGCVTSPPMTYTKLGGNEQDYKRDKFECMQASKTSWSGGGSGLIGLAMIAGSSSSAQDTANKTFQMCMDARGYTALAVREGETAAKERANSYCMTQIKASGQALGAKTFFPPISLATYQMLADNTKVTPEQRPVLIDWGNARQRCFDRTSQELASISYPQPLLAILKAMTITSNINIARLYRGEQTWGEFNQVRNDLNAANLKTTANVSGLLAHGTPDALQRVGQLVLDEQQATAERLGALTAAQPMQVGCSNLQMGELAFASCN